MLRDIGAGGMGHVYEAEDRSRGQRVALKRLHRRDSEALYWLKREFRALTGLTHPNLVALYDLVIEGNDCFFTMELVDGVPLLDYVGARRVDAAEAPTPPHASEWRRNEPLASNEQRLRACMRQLASGVNALHESGKVHCDIKPSNVLVTPDGRVVLLDFGLVSETRRRARELLDGRVFGTAEYMSPEQARSEPTLTPATDWYSVGVVLYVCLTGTLPFTGNNDEIVAAKLERAPAPPRAIVESVPEDLDELCVALLQRDPERRPTGRQVLERLGASPRSTLAAGTMPSGSASAPFTGRVTELATLTRQFYTIASGRSAAALVTGASGIGKSTLAREFLRQLSMRYCGLVALEGRCYEREHIPHKAMDPLIDELSRYLRELPRTEVDQLLPANAGALPRLFPVLGRIHSIAHAESPGDIADPGELRAVAATALRELFARVARRNPLVLFIDDVQWADADTLSLLEDLLRPPDPPPLLLLMCSRPEGRSTIERVCGALDLDLCTIDVSPLPGDDAIALATHLLGDRDRALVTRLATEAAGSPFLLTELACFAQTATDRELERVDVDLVLANRIAGLTADAQRLLEVIAVAGQPISSRVAATAAGLDSGTTGREEHALRSLHFARTAAGYAGAAIEPYHDRVREAVIAGLDAGRLQAAHRSLARALEHWDEGTPDVLARHWGGAGEGARAAEHTRAAADAAMRTLDFVQATRLYRLAIELGEYDSDTQRELLTSLGEAFTGAGRPADAADAFLEAATWAEAGDRLELRRRAAESLLRGGHLERGHETIGVVLEDIGMTLPATPRLALASLLWRRALLRVRGLRWRPRHRTEIAPRELTRVDVCWSVSSSLAIVNPILGSDYHARHLQLALRCGEQTRVSRALTAEAIMLAAHGYRDRAHRAVALAGTIAADIDDPFQRGMLHWARGAVAYYADNDWSAALAHMEEAEHAIQAALRSAGWEIDTCQLFACFALMYLGRLRDLSDRVPAYVRTAGRRGDRYGSTNFRTRLNSVLLVADRPDEAERDLRDAITAWGPSDGRFHVQHKFALIAEVELALYRGHAAAARRCIERDRDALRRSLLLRVATLRIEWTYLCGRAAIALAAAATDRRERDAAVRDARSAMRRLARESSPLGGAFAAMLRAGLGDEDDARAAVDACEDLGMAAHAAAARRRAGDVEAADAWMRDQGVVAPERWTAMLLPHIGDALTE